MSETRRWTHHCIWMVLLALAIRLVLVAFLYPERLNPDRDHWRFAGETGRIARSLVQGRGFSSPLHADTGPTAWMTPLYPALLAAIFRIFGVYTKASALAMLSLDSLFSALTCIPVFLIARKTFDQRVAVFAGWTWAFFPYAIYFSADFIWATTLTTFLLACIFYAALFLESKADWRFWLGFGALCGACALVDPIILSVAVPVTAWVLFRLLKNKQPWLMPTSAAALAFALVVSPWFIRNYQTFHAFIPFRDNVGLELYVGNQGQTWHFAPGGFHPSDTPREWAEFQQLGEFHYMQHKRARALSYIHSHPAAFLWLSVRRAIYMWTNFWSFSARYLRAEPADPFNILLCTSLTVLSLLGLWRAIRINPAAAAPFAIALFCFPIVYYFTHPEDYYRRPIDPLFVVLAAYAVEGWMANRSTRRGMSRLARSASAG